MKRVIIIGAFDRYNYGDNLMPILFELFLKEFYPGFFDRYQLVFSALTNSDLSRYKGKKSVAMSDVFSECLDDIEAVISIGGEVLCASSSSLFLHMNHSKNLNDRISVLKDRGFSFLADIFCRNFYKLPWEYPYVPKRLCSSIKIAFNTVGGGVSQRSLGTYIHSVRSRLSSADYLSVRDTRSESSLSKFCTPDVFPDSAITMAYFVGDQFLEKESCPSVIQLCKEDYICFQAAPKKVGASVSETVDALRKIATSKNLVVKLCPIGYANGHDDIDFLREVQQASGGEFDLVEDLNIWEIMSVIRNSALFVGTSLHGVITSLSYSIPYIGLNRKVGKLDRFLCDWGFGNSKRCYSVEELPEVFESIMNMDRALYQEHSRWLRGLGLSNNHKLVQALGLDK